MKEFIKNNKITYNLMSFTAFKTLLIFSLLLEAPRSYQEIIDYFDTHDFINEKISVDTIRVYINSLRRAGCVISKTKRAEGSKFILVSHPFELTITPEQIKPISRVYKTIAKTIEVSELIMLEKFLRKIASNIKNEDFENALNKTSLLSGIEIELLEKLLECCNEKKQIILKYNSPRSGQTNLEIICEKMGFENGKLYLYGTSLDFSQSSYLLAARIIGIEQIKPGKSDKVDIEELKIKFKVRADYRELQLKDNEKLLEISNNNTLIEAVSSNKFVLKQRILSFGSACTVLEPEDFKQEIITTLKRMRAEY